MIFGKLLNGTLILLLLLMISYLLFFICLFTWVGNSWTQTTIFSENMGTGTAGTTAIASTTFQNSGYTFSGTSDTRNNTNSTGYTGASGVRNVFFTASGRNFEIAGINTASYTGMELTFGMLTTTANQVLTVEVSSNGGTYAALTVPVTTSANTWTLKTASGTIPASANLSIRFTSASSAQFRLDDVKLTGTLVPTVTISNTGTPAAANVNTGTSNHVLTAFNLAPTASVNFTAISVTTSGTANTSDISNLRIFYDANANSIIDGAESSVSGTGIALAGTLSFSISGQTGITGTRRYLVVGDIEAGATPTRTITASVAAATDVTTTGTESGSASGNTQTIISVSPAPAITSSLVVSGTYGTAFSYSITATNSPTSYNATGLPAGLTINTSTGVISGTPTNTTGSPFTVSITATNASGTDTQNLALTINKLALTISGISISNKTYNGNNTAIITGTPLLTGIFGSDNVTVNGSPLASFASINVATGIPITVSGYTLGGTEATHYTLTQPTGLSANITVATLTISGAAAANKPYDGNTSATISGTLSGIFGSDAVSFTGTGTFASANAGTAIAVTFTGGLAGAQATNYILTAPSGLSANITQASQAITFGALPDKLVTDADFTLSATATSGLTVTYTSSNLAVATVTGNTVHIVGVGTTVITASQAGNVNFAAAADVNQNQLVITGPCYTENFSTIGSSTSYGVKSWTGTGGTWTATDAREDQPINGKAITIRTGSLTSPTFTDGIGSLTVTTKLNFSDAIGSLTVRINGNLLATTIPYSSSTTTTTISGIDISGSVVITITSSGARVSIDDVNWTCFAGCVSPGMQTSALSVSTITTTTVNTSWTAGNGDGTLIVIRPTIQSNTLPVSGTAYTPDLNYSAAGAIDANNKVIFSAAGSSAGPVTGLSPETQYHYRI